eukprot:31340-Pelagococcus_subviridis.AAC.16
MFRRRPQLAFGRVRDRRGVPEDDGPQNGQRRCLYSVDASAREASAGERDAARGRERRRRRRRRRGGGERVPVRVAGETTRVAVAAAARRREAEAKAEAKAKAEAEVEAIGGGDDDDEEAREEGARVMQFARRTKPRNRRRNERGPFEYTSAPLTSPPAKTRHPRSDHAAILAFSAAFSTQSYSVHDVPSLPHLGDARVHEDIRLRSRHLRFPVLVEQREAEHAAVPVPAAVYLLRGREVVDEVQRRVVLVFVVPIGGGGGIEGGERLDLSSSAAGWDLGVVPGAARSTLAGEGRRRPAATLDATRARERRRKGSEAIERETRNERCEREETNEVERGRELAADERHRRVRRQLVPVLQLVQLHVRLDVFPEVNAVALRAGHGEQLVRVEIERLLLVVLLNDDLLHARGVRDDDRELVAREGEQDVHRDTSGSGRLLFARSRAEISDEAVRASTLLLTSVLNPTAVGDSAIALPRSVGTPPPHAALRSTPPRRPRPGVAPPRGRARPSPLPSRPARATTRRTRRRRRIAPAGRADGRRAAIK